MSSDLSPRTHQLAEAPGEVREAEADDDGHEGDQVFKLSHWGDGPIGNRMGDTEHVALSRQRVRRLFDPANTAQ
jgi:hypothetical protein